MQRALKLMAGDGEGATKLLVCSVDGAEGRENGQDGGQTAICSHILFKAAMFGADANWGPCAVRHRLFWSGSGCGKNRRFLPVRKGRWMSAETARDQFSKRRASEVLEGDHHIGFPAYGR